MVLAKKNFVCESCTSEWHAADPHGLGLICPGCHGKLRPIARLDDATLETLKRELRVIFARMKESDDFDEGFFVALQGVQLSTDEHGQPILRCELGSTAYDDFVEGYEVGARTKKWLES